MMCMRGDIYYADFGRYVGSKQGGIRPALIVSNDKANVHSPVITVVPLTAKIGKKRFLPTHVLIPRSSGSGLTKNSLAMAEQVESLDKSFLLDYKGHISDRALMQQVTQALKIQIGAL